MLLFHYPEESEEELGREAVEDSMRDFSAYAQTLHQAGVLIAGQVLHPSTSTTTLSLVGGELRIQDGPFADTKEQLAGVVLIDVPDLDAALSWARQAPPAKWGTVEVRPGAVHLDEGIWVPS